MNIEMMISGLLEDCEAGYKLVKSVYTQDAELLRRFVSTFSESVIMLKDRCRFVYCDTAAYTDFAELLRAVMLMFLQDERLQPEDTRVRIEDIEDEQDVEELAYQFECLRDDFEAAGLYCLILFDHFDVAPDYWSSSDFGWVREVLDTSISMSCVLASLKFVSDITKLPVGSSAFWNIFSGVELEGEKAQ